MFKLSALLTFSLLLSACGGSSGGSDTDLQLPTPDPETSHLISSDGSTATVNEDNTALVVTGSSNTITINGSLSSLNVEGNMNLLIFVNGVNVTECVVSGSMNSAETNTGADAAIGCQDSGSMNSGF